MKIESINENLAAKLRQLTNSKSNPAEGTLITIHGCINIRELKDYDVSASAMQLAMCGVLAEDYHNVLGSMIHPLAGYYQDRFLAISRKLAEITEGNTTDEGKLRLSYKDIAFLICMLHDYLPAFQGSEVSQIASWAPRIQETIETLSQQTEYDYEAVMEKCNKGQEKAEPENDIGGDGLSQAYFKAKREQAYKEKQKQEKEKNNNKSR